MPITLENLDEVFSYHKWSPEQVQKGNAIRAAAKELAKAVILSAPEKYDPPEISPTSVAGSLRELAIARRQAALEMISETVMKANSAITFEAAELSPADTHSEQAPPDLWPPLNSIEEFKARIASLAEHDRNETLVRRHLGRLPKELRAKADAIVREMFSDKDKRPQITD